MSVKFAALVAGLALVGAGVSGCVESGPAYGGYGHHASTVYVQPRHRTDHDRHEPPRRPSHRYDHHDRDHHDRHDDHHGMRPGDHRPQQVDCRRDPHNRACRHRY